MKLIIINYNNGDNRSNNQFPRKLVNKSRLLIDYKSNDIEDLIILQSKKKELTRINDLLISQI